MRQRRDALAPGYRRDDLRWITDAKRPEARERRRRQAILLLAANVERFLEPGRKPPPVD